MADKFLHSFSVFVSVAVNHFTRSDGINYGAISIKYEMSVCLYSCLSGYTMFSHILS